MAKLIKKHYLVPAIKRCFDLIDLLSGKDKGLTVTEIHRTLHLPLSSAAAILYTLQALGYVEKDPESSRYTLSTKLFSLSGRMSDQFDLVGRSHALLEQLAAESGFTAHTAVMREGESMYVDRVPGTGLMQFSSYVGMRWPLHASGVGKALLAFLPKDELTQTLKYLPLSKLTKYTITVKQQLEQQLRQFQRLGYAWEVNEGEPGVACVAAPIFGPDHILLAAVSVVGTTHQISEERIPTLGVQVKHFADAMSARLGTRSPEVSVPAGGERSNAALWNR
jgi:DNA-binding IclR family transcriptional regulator